MVAYEKCQIKCKLLQIQQSMLGNLHTFTEYFLSVIKYLPLAINLFIFSVVKCLCPSYYGLKQPLFCIFIIFLLILWNDSLWPLVEGVGLLQWEKQMKWTCWPHYKISGCQTNIASFFLRNNLIWSRQVCLLFSL